MIWAVGMGARSSPQPSVMAPERWASKSILCGKTLGELKLGSETGMFVIAMRHQDRWLYGPTKKTRIESGDILFAKGPEDGEKHLLELASGKSKKI